MPDPASSRPIGVVIPVYREPRDRVEALAQDLVSQGFDEVVIVEATDGAGAASGGRLDGSPRIRHLSHPRPGRAAQMNRGLKTCKADTVLFLHADTRLPGDARAAIAEGIERGGTWGRFDVRLDSSRFPLPLVSFFMNLRSRLTGIATGDQAIFVRREVMESVGGYADIPLMEDIELSRRLKKIAPPLCVGSRATTSARRWESEGVTRTILKMWALRLLYFAGVSPSRLKNHYSDLRRDST